MDEFSGLGGVVTGAGSGIGLAVTMRLAEEGANVLAVDTRTDALEGAAAHAIGLSGRVVPHEADVTIVHDVMGYVDRAMKEFGNLRFFFNNAGVESVYKSIIDMPLDDWDRVINVNLRAAFLGLKYVLPAMIASGGGSIVNIGSVLSLKAAPCRSDYVVAKHGIVGLTRAAACEHAKDGVKVNAVCPGPVETPMMNRWERQVNPLDPKAVKRHFEARLPIGRYGRPEEVADLVTYLLSPRIPYLTGAIISIDGGVMTI